MEKWTAADEKLYAELNARRQEIMTRRFDALTNALGFCGIESIDAWVTANRLIKAPAKVVAALEPFVLAAEGESDG